MSNKEKKDVFSESVGSIQPEIFSLMHGPNWIYTLVDETEAARMLCRAIQTLRNDRHLRKGVPYIRMGRSVRYRIGDLLRYINEHRIEFE